MQARLKTAFGCNYLFHAVVTVTHMLEVLLLVAASLQLHAESNTN